MMKEDHMIDFKIVAQQMRGQLTHIAMWRKIVRLLIYTVYPLALLSCIHDIRKVYRRSGQL